MIEYKYIFSNSKNDIVNTLTKLFSKKDSETMSHCRRVKILAVGFAEFMKIPEESINILRNAALLHDIGKTTVSKEIIYKPSRLSQEEFEIIKTHPIMACKLLSSIDILEKEAKIILSHHERVDGLGYPYGLKSNEIDYLAKILSICDSYDAMVSERPYRMPLTSTQAISELEKHSGTQFDSELVTLFIKYITAPGHRRSRSAAGKISNLSTLKM
jgi:putative nucleotidyltransferase with HDIG domain